MKLGALTVVALLTVTTPAVADNAREQAAAVDRAKAHFERGRQLSEAKQFAAAYTEFAAGYAASPRPLFQFNMGECSRALGRTSEARDHYQRYLAAEPNGAFASTARTRLADLTDAKGAGQRPRTGVAPAPASTGTVTTTSPPPRTAGSTVPTTSLAPRTGSSTVPTASPAPRTGATSVTASPAISTGQNAEPASSLQTFPAAGPATGAGETQLTGTRSFNTPRESGRPLYKRPVFWVGVGVVVAGGVALTYAMTRDPSCTGANCVDLR